MENVPFQHHFSSNPSTSSRYPLSLDQRLAQGDRYREAAEQLDGTLREIDRVSNLRIHTGRPTCDACTERNLHVKQAFYKYYLGNEPGRWDKHCQHGADIMDRFSLPNFELEYIHQRYKNELKDHLRKDICAVIPDDAKDAADLKIRMECLLRDLPMEDAIFKGFQEKIDYLAAVPALDGQVRMSSTEDPTHPAGFLVRLQSTKTDEERAALYISYYCTASPDDTPQLRNMKTKYARHFESTMSHDTVLNMWKAEAEEARKRQLGIQQQRLFELKYAQSAHLKAKQKKLMKEDARLKEGMTHVVECSLPACDKQMDKSKAEVIECAVCDWLSRTTDHRRHAYYCSQDHNDEDFYEHDRHDHGCSMGDQCYYLMDPPELENCGICSDCLENGILSFFCSQACYLHTHRDDVHYDGGEDGGFVNFQPLPGLELISS